ncbi:MraY family glycosyltransferase [Nemorincola caseinilytica]|uniref:MraY family glycosyltransferase n=1 Tax=Nemorincola caseinilytica TaxID=2054315 RepID=A0ABP8NCU2_9BACT
MPETVPTYFQYILAILCSSAISVYAVRKIIFIARTRKLYDIPDNIRKIHGAQIPSLGGIGIFIGYLTTAAFFIERAWFAVVAASVILFFTGIYDDIMNMRPSKKLVAQLAASAVAIMLADVRITSLHGILGIYELSYPVSVGLTVFCCTFFINVFNFMDGIDGLACTLAILYTGVLGMLFAFMGSRYLAGISFSIMGATAGLFWFNRPPARIYMGDTGSMLLGFTIFILTVCCMYMGSTPVVSATPLHIHTDLGMTMLLLAMLLLPVYDAVRVFILRTLRGISPLRADRLHLHYYLLDAGLSHRGAVGVLAGTNVAVMLCAWALQAVHPLLLLLCMLLIITLVVWVVWALRQKKMRAA